MPINPSIFKSYDIRGIYPEELDEEAAYKIARAFVSYSGASDVVVGRDMRLGSPAVSRAVMSGLTDGGANVCDIGMVSIDAFYYALNKYGYEGGIMVTASHNPKQWTGCKMFGPGNQQVSGLKGMAEIRETATAGDFSPVGRKGQLAEKDILSEFVSFAIKLFDPGKIRPFRVVLDAGSGMASCFLEEALKYLPIEPIKMGFVADGSFPLHEPNPIKPENTKLAQEEVLKQGADLGFSFDGDADRIILIDERGQRVANDITLAFLAEWFLKKYPGAAIVKQIVCSRAVDEAVLSSGGKVAVSRVGTSFIKDAMGESGAVFAGEISGHFYFKDFWNFDSGLISFLAILQMISESGRKPSQIVSETDRYFRSGEINSEIRDEEKVFKKLESEYADGKKDCLDGLTVGYEDWWFNVRLSQTEPLVRLNVEAKTREKMEKERDRILAIVRE